jgi:hypothetical protein
MQERSDKRANGWRSLLWAAAVLFLAAFALRADPAFTLAGPSARTAIIIGATQPAYQYPYWGGHEILQRYLMLITGITVPIVTDASLAGQDLDALYDFRIWVGDQPKVQQVLGPQLAALDDDGFIIRCTGRDLYLCGRYKWGTHWAPYELLEQFAGCRWYMESGQRWWMPAEDGMVGIGDIIPAAAVVTIPTNTDIVAEPSYKMRWFRIVPDHSFRVRYRDKFHHNMVGIIPPSVYGSTHPEYFPEIGGVRRIPPENRDYDFQPCLSNTNVVNLVSDTAIAYFDANPQEGTFSIGMNDSDKYCQCASCMAMAPSSITDSTERVAWSYFTFYNNVAARVAAVHPGKRLGCLAYAALSSLPAGSLALHTNLVPYLTRDSAQLFDPDEKAEFDETVSRWSTLASRMGIYEYMFGQGFIIPRIYNRYLLNNITNRYGAGVDGFYAEASPNWGLDGPKYWLASKLLWNHRLDPETLLADYYQNMFGPVGSVMRQYFDFLEETWCTQTLENPHSNYRWYEDPAQLQIFSIPRCDTAWNTLQTARAQAGALVAQAGTPAERATATNIRNRVEFFSSSFELTRTMSYRYNSALALERLATNPPVPFGEGMAGLESWLAPGSLRAAYDRAAALKFAVSLAPYDSFTYQFDGNPGPGQTLHALVENAVSSAGTGGKPSRQDMIARTQAALQSQADAVPGFASSNALAWVKSAAAESGFLMAVPTAVAPDIDGRISPGEWPTPAYDGCFYQFGRIDERTSYRTTIYACTNGSKLHLAFDCRADTNCLSAAVTGRDSDPGPYPLMANDDCISINLFRTGYAYQTLRVNLNGSIQDFYGSGAWDVCTARVSRVDGGWQAELAIDMMNTHLRPDGLESAPTWVCISRYYHTRDSSGTLQWACSTLAPCPRFGNVIGYGNHDACMVFVYGPRLVYGSPTEPSRGTLMLIR